MNSPQAGSRNSSGQNDNSRGYESRPGPCSRERKIIGYKDFSAKAHCEVFRILRIAEAEDNPNPVIGSVSQTPSAQFFAAFQMELYYRVHLITKAEFGYT
jgi:hypothetical protein